ncbi:Peptidase S28 [Penicillium cf. griseofulvum]|uniref:Peptidase S28 n=1 Tax=Penicillium cf. griseofulvum TaxID=2972120 RepID=A0A9W9IUS0_9EURO|nr:Peptidase S28 [Penicillium cf. griseofulvum]KAJ5430814.1 Peptidase S28 [Penicillium cf. griseofulvum]KAJ5435414.1 Peptidase S28 [Penicillium cf. griseofulvum]
MHFSTAVLAVLSGTAAGIATSQFKRDLRLSAELGVHPDILLRQKTSVHAIASTWLDGAIKPEHISLPIDHSNSSVGTYLNRYWVSEQHYKKGGPVFVYDAGEQAAAASAQSSLGNSTSFFYQLIEEFGGIGIVWEHRYYGESLPYNVSIDTEPENFMYLNNKQALADIPFFAAKFTRANYSDVDLTPSATPWVMVGGSYAGMRSAFTRHLYPNTIYAAYASSAPVEARIDMSVYFDQVYDGMAANGHLNCTRDIKAALEYIDEQLSNSKSSAAIKRRFLGEGAEKNTNGDFSSALQTIYWLFQSYGLGGGTGSLDAFCAHMETDPETGAAAPPHGFAPTRGKKYAAHRYASWPVFTQLTNSYFDTNCKQLETSQPLVCDLSAPSSDPDTISWTWQYCTEWGYFQTNNFGPHSLLSKFQTLDYAQEYCNRYFPEAIKKGLFPERPQVEATNAETGGWSIRPSNVYWSGGQFDPWRTLSPLAAGTRLAPAGVNSTTDIPKCNVETDKSTVFGYTMQNAEHCFDFRTTFAPGAISRGYFTGALKEWLKCFGAK